MTSIPIPSAPNRLFVVTARLEFQYPVLAESREAAESQRVTKEAMNDPGEAPWDIKADKAGPAHAQPAAASNTSRAACLVIEESLLRRAVSPYPVGPPTRPDAGPVSGRFSPPSAESRGLFPRNPHPLPRASPV